MDVRPASRLLPPHRARLPFVASLLLAALFGAPAPAGQAVAPRPVPVAVASAASATVTRTTETVAAEPGSPPPPAGPADGTPAGAAPRARVLADQVGTAARGPRAPPRSA